MSMKRFAIAVTMGLLAALSTAGAQAASNTSAVTGGIFQQDLDYIVSPTD